MESLLRIQEADPGLLSSIDYLMAAADYQDFINLMLDFREGFEYAGADQVMEHLGEGIQGMIQEEEEG